MMFQNFGLTEKKLLLLFLSCLFFWWLLVASGTCSASETPEPVYQITEQELTTLENNISKLKTINENLQTDLKIQSDEATRLRKQLDELKKELSDLKTMSQKQESSLTSANKLLDKYATEVQQERKRIKTQRNIWEAVAACLIVGLIVK